MKDPNENSLLNINMDQIEKKLDRIERKIHSQFIFTNLASEGEQSIAGSLLDLEDLCKIVWDRKIFIIVFGLLFAVGSVIYALSKPNLYEAKTILASADSGSGVSRISGQLGGIASLAGINLSAGESSKDTIAIELLTSWGFIEEFIERNKIKPEVYAVVEWNKEQDKLVYDVDMYDAETKKWAPNKKGIGKPTAEPTSWELYEAFLQMITITQNKDTGLIELAVEHYSPVLASKWAQLLVIDINNHMRRKDVEEAEKSIAFLKKQLSETSISDVQNMFFQIMEDQIKTLMLASVNDEYVLKTISPAKVPEIKSRPKRAMIVVLVTMVGAMLGFVIAIAHGLLKYREQKD